MGFKARQPAFLRRVRTIVEALPSARAASVPRRAAFMRPLSARRAGSFRGNEDQQKNAPRGERVSLSRRPQFRSHRGTCRPTRLPRAQGAGRSRSAARTRSPSLSRQPCPGDGAPSRRREPAPPKRICSQRFTAESRRPSDRPRQIDRRALGVRRGLDAAGDARRRRRGRPCAVSLGRAERDSDVAPAQPRLDFGDRGPQASPAWAA